MRLSMTSSPTALMQMQSGTDGSSASAAWPILSELRHRMSDGAPLCRRRGQDSRTVPSDALRYSPRSAVTKLRQIPPFGMDVDVIRVYACAEFQNLGQFG